MKIFIKTMVAGALALSLSSWVSAATLSGGELEYGESEVISLGRDTGLPAFYDFNFYGGSINFLLISADPKDRTSSLTLTKSVSGVFSQIEFLNQVFDLKDDTTTASSYTVNSLLSGLYRLTLGSSGGDASNAKIDKFLVAGFAPAPNVSPVPLPGAALLFASSLLGAGALRRRKVKQNQSTPGALPA